MWRWGGDFPQLISAKVQPIIDSIDQTKLNEMIGAKHRYEYRLYIGNVTIDNNEYTNAWICFDVRREKFYIRATIHKPLDVTEHTEDKKKRLYFGSDNGYVYKQSLYIDDINSDDGYEIDYFFTTNSLDF
jgi:hypothetical protein